MIKRSSIITILIAGILLGGANGLAQDKVAIYGVVSVVSGGLDELSFVVYGKELEARKVPISKKGKFYFTIPVDQVAFIRCAKPGYLTKRVKIDTHNAFVTKFNARYNKEVDFDLEMIPQVYKDKAEGYIGPVATLAFNERSGLLKITYDYRKRKRITPEQLLVENKR